MFDVVGNGASSPHRDGHLASGDNGGRTPRSTNPAHDFANWCPGDEPGRLCAPVNMTGISQQTVGERVLITGGAGFIGRALVDRCLAHGHHVTVVDNLSAGRLEHLQPFVPRIEFHRVDILDADTLDAALFQARPAIVFHLAAHHYVPFCNAHPRETLRTNVEGTFNVLHAAASHGARVAVVASSAAIYPGLDIPLHEEIVADPVDVYGTSKLMVEQVAKLESRRLPCVVARLFNTYGPYETNSHLIPAILESLGRGGDISLGNVHTLRDYVYVDDVAAMLYRFAFVGQGSLQTFNVGTGIEYSAADIVDTIGRLVGLPLRIRVDPARMRAIDKPHQRASMTRVAARLGAPPTRTLEDGLRALLHHERFAVVG